MFKNCDASWAVSRFDWEPQRLFQVIECDANISHLSLGSEQQNFPLDPGTGFARPR